MLEAYTYVPILYTKNAELLALKKLDSSLRSRVLPIIGIRPGQHKDFQKSLEKYKDSTSGLRVGLTLDETRYGKCKSPVAKEQFDALFDPEDGFRNFFNFVGDWEAAIPVLQTKDGIFQSIEDQISNSVSLDRGFIVRVRQHESVSFLECLESGVLTGQDFAVIIDAEWQEDVLIFENWASRLILQITSDFPNIAIVTASSSFPRDFSNIEGKGVIINDDREFFDRIKRNHNEANLIFGDWGSTRSASERPGAKPRPRVDIATIRDWVSFRLDKNGKGGFPAVALMAENDFVWLSTPDCWGKRLIELTARKRPQQIKGNQSANAARINIHLTVQAMSDTMVQLPDEPFTDDF
jgi:hypothetical protein